MALEKRAELGDVYPAKELDRLANLLHNPGISVMAEALSAAEVGGVHAMHDPTEGGVATGLQELSLAANVGLEIFADRLPYHPDCLTLCQRFGLDPLGIIASGSLLIAADPGFAPAIQNRLADIGIQVARIGRVRPPEFGLQLVGPEGKRPLPTFARDEIAKLFE
jgi:hydrogenase maturation factor